MADEVKTSVGAPTRSTGVLTKRSFGASRTLSVALSATSILALNAIDLTPFLAQRHNLHFRQLVMTMLEVGGGQHLLFSNPLFFITPTTGAPPGPASGLYEVSLPFYQPTAATAQAATQSMSGQLEDLHWDDYLEVPMLITKPALGGSIIVTNTDGAAAHSATLSINGTIEEYIDY